MYGSEAIAHSLIQRLIPWQRLFAITLELLLALPLGLVLTQLGMGGMARFLGGMVAGAAVIQGFRVLTQVIVPPNRITRKIGQALVGLVIGFAIADANFAEIATKLPIFCFLALLLLAGGSGIGYLYARVSQTNLMTSMLATAPGGVTLMPSIAADYNKNVALVSFVQIIRLTSVISLVPLLARWLDDSDAGVLAAMAPQLTLTLDPLSLSLLLLALLLTLVVTQLGTRLKIPVAPFFAAILVGGLFNPLLQGLPWLGAVEFHLPASVNFIGQILLGISIGEYWGNKPVVSQSAVKSTWLSVGLTLMLGLVTAAIALVITPWDWLTCLLLTAPGGAPEMILVALTLDHNVEVVTAGHLVRLVAINLSLPGWLLLVRYLERHFPAIAEE